MSPRIDSDPTSVRVRFRRTITVSGGAQYHANEVAGFDREFAAKLVSEDVADFFQEESASMPAPKHMDHAPVDKMVKTAPTKGGRQ